MNMHPQIAANQALAALQTQGCDFLRVQGNQDLIRFLDKNAKEQGFNVESVQFSDTVLKINKREKHQKRDLIITTAAVYNFKDHNYRACQRCIPITSLRGIVLAPQSDEVLLQVKNDYDYRLLIVRKADAVRILVELYALRTGGEKLHVEMNGNIDTIQILKADVKSARRDGSIFRAGGGGIGAGGANDTTASAAGQHPGDGQHLASADTGASASSSAAAGGGGGGAAGGAAASTGKGRASSAASAHGVPTLAGGGGGQPNKPHHLLPFSPQQLQQQQMHLRHHSDMIPPSNLPAVALQHAASPPQAAAQAPQLFHHTHMPANIDLKPTIEGWLVKKGQMNQEWKRRYFRLSETNLLYYEARLKGTIELAPEGEVKPWINKRLTRAGRQQQPPNPRQSVNRSANTSSASSSASTLSSPSVSASDSHQQQQGQQESLPPLMYESKLASVYRLAPERHMRDILVDKTRLEAFVAFAKTANIFVPGDELFAPTPAAATGGTATTTAAAAQGGAGAAAGGAVANNASGLALFFSEVEGLKALCASFPVTSSAAYAAAQTAAAAAAANAAAAAGSAAAAPVAASTTASSAAAAAAATIAPGPAPGTEEYKIFLAQAQKVYGTYIAPHLRTNDTTATAGAATGAAAGGGASGGAGAGGGAGAAVNPSALWAPLLAPRAIKLAVGELLARQPGLLSALSAAQNTLSAAKTAEAKSSALTALSSAQAALAAARVTPDSFLLLQQAALEQLQSRALQRYLDFSRRSELAVISSFRVKLALTDDDLQIKSCSQCLSTFGLLKRRHWCRHCGDVFCSACLTKTARMPLEGPAPPAAAAAAGTAATQQAPASSSSNTTSTNTKSAAEADSDAPDAARSSVPSAPGPPPQSGQVLKVCDMCYGVLEISTVHPHAFSYALKSRNRPINLAASSPQEMQDWLQSMRDAIGKPSSRAENPAASAAAAAAAAQQQQDDGEESQRGSPSKAGPIAGGGVVLSTAAQDRDTGSYRPPQHKEGWLLKEDPTTKTWRKRYFILAPAGAGAGASTAAGDSATTTESGPIDGSTAAASATANAATATADNTDTAITSSSNGGVAKLFYYELHLKGSLSLASGAGVHATFTKPTLSPSDMSFGGLEAKSGFGYRFHISYGSRLYALAADSDILRDRWISEIQKAIRRARPGQGLIGAGFSAAAVTLTTAAAGAAGGMASLLAAGGGGEGNNNLALAATASPSGFGAASPLNALSPSASSSGADGFSSSSSSASSSAAAISSLTSSYAQVAPEGEVTFVFTDVQNSTKLWEACPEGMNKGLEKHDSLLRTLLALFRGYEVKTEGDAFMVTFFSPLDAVRWCLACQSALLETVWPSDLLTHPSGCREVRDGRVVFNGLRIRMGIHFGHPACRRNPITGRMDYFGPVVNRSARVSDSAHGGQVVCTAEVQERLVAAVAAGEFPLSKLTITDMGMHRYKGISELVQVYQIYDETLEKRHPFPPLRTTKADEKPAAAAVALTPAATPASSTATASTPAASASGASASSSSSDATATGATVHRPSHLTVNSVSSLPITPFTPSAQKRVSRVSRTSTSEDSDVSEQGSDSDEEVEEDERQARMASKRLSVAPEGKEGEEDEDAGDERLLPDPTLDGFMSPSLLSPPPPPPTAAAAPPPAQ